MRLRKSLLAVFALALLAPRPAHATFHLMQVEQVVGGVNGDANYQAIQLRFRTSFQNFVSGGKLVAYDANGENPVLLSNIATNVTTSAAGTRVLLATANFSTITTPSVVPDYTLVNKIPASYLVAGSLTWEDKTDDSVLWRISWGGAGYAGLTDGTLTNDADGEFGPALADPLQSTSLQALKFNFAASALSTNNVADYSVTGGAASFTNSHNASGTLTAPLSVGPGGPGGLLALVAPAPNPVTSSMSYAVVLPREMQVDVRLHDVTGRTVRSLVSGTLAAGRHSYSWVAPTAAALPNGVYFLEMSAQGARQTQRFVLMR